MANGGPHLTFGLSRALPGLARARFSPGPPTASLPSWAVIGGASILAIGCGRFFADGHVKYAAALVLGAIYAPLVLFDLAAALAVWTAVLFFHDLTALSVGPNTMGVLVGLGWIGAFLARSRPREMLREHRGLLFTIILFCLWLTVSIAWAEKPGVAATEAGYWWLAALAYLITLTTLTRGRDIGLVVLAFVAGAVVAATIGLASGSVYSSTSNTAVQARLVGGGGDPNLQAAALIAAMFLVIGLLSVYRRRWARLGLVLAFMLVAVAFFATKSRGGLIALGASAIVAFLLSPGQRRRILGFISLAAIVAAAAVALSPGSLSRITNFGGGSSGRNDIWRAAASVFKGHPVAGVGLSNFPVVEPRFALRLQNVSRVSYLAEKPYLAHNTYLQLLAETGVIGLIGYLAVVFSSLRAAWLASKLFDRIGRPEYAQLARASLIAAIGMLTAIFFITDGNDWRLWILLGLGPALLTLARAEQRRIGTVRRSERIAGHETVYR